MKKPDLKPKITEIFEFWKEIMNHPAAKLLPVRERAVAARLREGYSVDEIKNAILGCNSSDFHMGANDAGTVYDDLTMICRNGAKLEFYIGLLRKAPRSRHAWQEIGRNTEPPIAEEPTPVTYACPLCFDTGQIDAFPEDPSFRPGRWQPCPSCPKGATQNPGI